MRAKISRSGLSWALRALVVDHDTVSVIPAKLAMSWHTANSAVLAEGHRLLINDAPHFDNVTVIIDLTPSRLPKISAERHLNGYRFVRSGLTPDHPSLR